MGTNLPPKMLSMMVLGILTFALSLCVTYTHCLAAPLLERYIEKVEVKDVFPGADAMGPLREDVPVRDILSGGKTVGYLFLTSDFVITTGYSGKPIHIIMAVDVNGTITGAKLVKHSEPIVLVGIPESKITKFVQGYRGVDLVAESRKLEANRKLDIVSGATVTIMVIDDSIIRAGLKVAHKLGLGGLKPIEEGGPKRQLLQYKQGEIPLSDWTKLTGDGSIRDLDLTVGEVNQAFEESGDPKAIKRPEKGPKDTLFIDLRLALASVPEIGFSLLGKGEYEQMKTWLKEGEQAILVLGRGRYSFKGSGYVRGGIFDRIQLIQGQNSWRFHDFMHRRVGQLAIETPERFKEHDLFKIPADSGFDPSKPFRLQLLVQRQVGALEKRFVTFDVGYQLPQRYLKPLPVPAKSEAANQTGSGAQAGLNETASDELSHLWKRIWIEKQYKVAMLVAAIIVLTGIFFFQMQVTRNEKFAYWLRIAFLAFTLIVLGWYAKAQLSIVNLLALFDAFGSGFSWSAFLMDPLIFILWFSVAASLLFWGRGVYCGWLCPFGALQELTNKIARFFKVPQITVPWGLHERLWPLKYMIFLGLFGLSMYSLDQAERYSEVEPFKTAIILNFQRSWPFVLYGAVLIAAGLFIERFYCRYLCPLGAALAIPARLRMFDWLKRYHECGYPCQRCANECMVQAIHPEGNINPNECHQCLHCQVLYQSKTKCPVVIKKETKRARFMARSGENSTVKDTGAAKGEPAHH